MSALEIVRVLNAYFTYQILAVAEIICAVDEFLRRTLTEITLPNQLGFIGEIDRFAAIEGVERTFPESAVAIFLAVTDDSPFDLIDLVETTFFHDRSEDFAANSSSAVGNDGLVLQVVVFPAIELSNKVFRSSNIWNDGILESAYFCFVCVTTIKEDQVIA